MAPRQRRLWAFAAMLALFALALLTAGLFANVNRQQLSGIGQLRGDEASSNSVTVALPNLIRPLTPDEAVRQNEARPFNATPDTPARKFLLAADQDSRDRAIDCLTQAVYYEAGSEGAEGERAVAQVVLNRMRHPGFPATVCGVVYQGSELPTGCQFTFTCDGSLARVPIAALWTQARRIAADALGGKVDAAVGHATHYHADYVLPYWADSLLKQVQIGHHIFYRLKGGLGSSAAFSQGYGGKEPNLPLAPSTIAVANQATDQAQELLGSGLAGATPLAADAGVLAAAEDAPKQVLLADNAKGVLLSDQPGAPAPKAKRRASDECTTGGSKQILPAAPNDLKKSSADAGC